MNRTNVRKIAMIASIVSLFIGCQDPTEPPHEHSFDSYVVNPTCTEKGYTRYTSNCGHNVAKANDTETDALGHDFGDNLEKCSRCETANPNYVAPHEHSFEKKSDATCTEPSKEECECGEITNSVNALGHDFGDNSEKCSRCEAVNPDYVAPHEHSFDSYVVNPTCTEKGYTRYTSTCGHNVTKPNDTETNALGHDFSNNAKKCSRCETENPNYVAPHEHSFESEVIKPTCTEKGYTKYTCTCGHNATKANDTETDALGHDFGDNLEKCNRCGIANPNYVEQTPQTYTCSSCNTVYNTETEKDNCNKLNGCPKYVAQHQHNFVKVSDATCTEPSTEKCECGNETHKVNALGHSKDNGTFTTKPTCNSNGKVIYKCMRCNSVMSTENVEKVGHSYQDDRCIHCGITDPSSIPNIEAFAYVMDLDCLLVWIDGKEIGLTNPVKEDTYRTYFLYNKWAVMYDTSTKEIIYVILI